MSKTALTTLTAALCRETIPNWASRWQPARHRRRLRCTRMRAWARRLRARTMRAQRRGARVHQHSAGVGTSTMQADSGAGIARMRRVWLRGAYEHMGACTTYMAHWHATCACTHTQAHAQHVRGGVGRRGRECERGCMRTRAQARPRVREHSVGAGNVGEVLQTGMSTDKHVHCFEMYICCSM